MGRLDSEMLAAWLLLLLLGATAEDVAGSLRPSGLVSLEVGRLVDLGSDSTNRGASWQIKKCSEGTWLDTETGQCRLCKPFDLLGRRARKRGLEECRAECNECKRVFAHPDYGEICWSMASIERPGQQDPAWRRISAAEGNNAPDDVNATFPQGISDSLCTCAERLDVCRKWRRAPGIRTSTWFCRLTDSTHQRLPNGDCRMTQEREERASATRMIIRGIDVTKGGHSRWKMVGPAQTLGAVVTQSSEFSYKFWVKIAPAVKTAAPTKAPTKSPTDAPTTGAPSHAPSDAPTGGRRKEETMGESQTLAARRRRTHWPLTDLQVLHYGDDILDQQPATYGGPHVTIAADGALKAMITLVNGNT